jgi:CBS domain-containing protein
MNAQLSLPDARLAAAGGIVAGTGAAVLASKRRRSRRSAGRTARDVMTHPVTCVGEDEPVARAAERLAADGVGALPVCDRGGRLIGMLTDRDIVLRVVAQGEEPERVTAGACTTPEPVAIAAEEPVGEARARMASHRVRRLPVVDGRRVVGIVSQADVAAHSNPGEAGRLVDAISRGGRDGSTSAWLMRRPH